MRRIGCEKSAQGMTMSIGKYFVCAAATFVLIFAAAASARASSIGVFGYVVDSELGPIFSVENTSDGEFSDVLVRLFDGAFDVRDLTLGTVDPFSLQQTIDDLTILPTPFDHATLEFSYSLPGTLTVQELAGLSLDPGGTVGNTTSVSIDFAPAAQPVPEPATILLVAVGGALVIRARGRRERPRTSC
jgi:hypothetical protein